MLLDALLLLYYYSRFPLPLLLLLLFLVRRHGCLALARRLLLQLAQPLVVEVQLRHTQRVAPQLGGAMGIGERISDVWRAWRSACYLYLCTQLLTYLEDELAYRPIVRARAVVPHERLHRARQPGRAYMCICGVAVPG